MRQLDRQGIEPVKPDPVAQAVLFMNQHYARPITLVSLVEMLDCNPRQFLRWFKSRHQTSPIDYIIRLRMAKANELLLRTDCTLKEIAESIGYPDSYPHMARRLVGNRYGIVIPTAALIGAIVLLLADLAGRTLFLPLDIPAPPAWERLFSCIFCSGAKGQGVNWQKRKKQRPHSARRCFFM